MSVTPEALRDLSAPTPDTEKKQRPAPRYKDKVTGEYRDSGKMLTYVDARYVQDVLDRVIGPGDWQNKFQTDPKGNLTCGIGINVEQPNGDTEWVWKWDVGTESDIEAVKGNYSDAFKRAAVHWGIARDLYDDRSAPTTGSFRSGSSASGGAAVGGAPVEGGRIRSADGPVLTTDWKCPLHHEGKVVPAATSKRTGRPYPAFVACPVSGCEQKPPRGTKPIEVDPTAKSETGYVAFGDGIDEELTAFDTIDDGYEPS